MGKRRINIVFDESDISLLEGATTGNDRFDSYSAAVRRAVRIAFGKKEVPA